MKYCMVVLLLSQMSALMENSLFARARVVRSMTKTPLWLSRRQNVQALSKDIHKIYQYPTNRRRVVLQNRNQHHLIMKPETGRLMGTKIPKLVKKFGKFELQRYRPGVVRIFNLRTRKYIAIDKGGKAYATRTRSADTLFRDTMVTHDGFHSYHSYMHRTVDKRGTRKWYLAIKKDGRLKRPSRTLSRHRSIEFLPEDYRIFKLRTMNAH